MQCNVESEPRPDWNTSTFGAESRLASEPGAKSIIRKYFHVAKSCALLVFVSQVQQFVEELGGLAALDTEAAFAETGWNAAVAALRAFNVTHGNDSFSFQSGNVTTIQTLAGTAQRRRLESDVRTALVRRNAAWAKRAELLMAMGKIK